MCDVTFAKVAQMAIVPFPKKRCANYGVRWGNAHPFGGKHDLVYLFSSKAETVNAATYAHLLTR